MLTYINDKQTHLKDSMSSFVLELFWVIGKFPGRPYVAVIDVGGCHDKRKDLVLRNIENGWKWGFYTSERVRGFCVQKPCQWLVTASSLDCRCYKSGNSPVLNNEWEKRAKKEKNEQPLGTGFDSHTKALCRRDHFWLHRSRCTSVGEKPCCTYKSASWRELGSIAEHGNEYLMFSNQVSSAFQAAQPETDRPSWCNILNLLLIGKLICHSSETLNPRSMESPTFSSSTGCPKRIGSA